MWTTKTSASLVRAAWKQHAINNIAEHGAQLNFMCLMLAMNDRVNVPSIRPKPVYYDCSYDSHTCISI